jgi:hypothetical protein
VNLVQDYYTDIVLVARTCKDTHDLRLVINKHHGLAHCAPFLINKLIENSNQKSTAAMFVTMQVWFVQS